MFEGKFSLEYILLFFCISVYHPKEISKLVSQGFPWQKKATFLLEGYASLTLQSLPHLSETYVLPQYESEATLQSLVGKCPNRLETTFCYGAVGNDDDNLLLWELLAIAFGKWLHFCNVALEFLQILGQIPSRFSELHLFWQFVLEKFCLFIVFLRAKWYIDYLFFLLAISIIWWMEWASLVTQLVKNLPAMQEIPVRFPGQKVCWRRDGQPTPVFLGFPGGSVGKESACNVGDLGSIPGLGRSPGEGKGYSLQFSGLENYMDCVVHLVTKSWNCVPKNTEA